VGHSAATFREATAGYSAGAKSTTHLFNAMSGIDHRSPGVAVAALLDESVFTELIADGVHVDRALWPLITRLKGPDRLLLVSDAISLAGTGDGRGRIGTLDVEVTGDRVTLVGTSTLAGSVTTTRPAIGEWQCGHTRASGFTTSGARTSSIVVGSALMGALTATGIGGVYINGNAGPVSVAAPLIGTTSIAGALRIHGESLRANRQSVPF